MNTIVKEVELTFEEYNKRLMDSRANTGTENRRATYDRKGWTLHIGPLKICFGSVSRLPEITRYTYKSPVPVLDDVLSADIISELDS